MSKRFDRADGESRQLRAAFGDLGDRLADYARRLRGELHDAYYPGFGLVSGMRRRAIILRLKPWETLFRDSLEKLFRWSSEIEAKLVYSIATEDKPELPIIFDQLRERRQAADQLARAMSWRIRALQRGAEMDTEAVFDFCQMAERAALYLQLASVALFLPSSAERAAVRDPRFLDLDWDEIESMARDLPLAFRTEVIQPDPYASPRPPSRRNPPAFAREAGGDARRRHAARARPFSRLVPARSPGYRRTRLGSLRDGLIDRLFELSPSLALASLFAYWMFMASASIITFGWGSLFASLLGTLILLGMTVGLLVAYREARLRAEADEIWRLGALLLAIPTLFFVATVLLLPLMVVVVLVTYALASLPVALMR